MQAMTSLAECATQFTNHSLKIDGRSYFYREANPNASDTIVVVHGVTGTSYSMLVMASRWLSSGRRIIVPDLPSHGHSADLPLEQFEDLATWLHQFLAALSPQGSVTLVGNSFGCAVVWVYASRYQLPAGWKLVLGAPTPRLSRLSSKLFQLARQIPVAVAKPVYYNPPADTIRTWVILGQYSEPTNRQLVQESLRAEVPLIHHAQALDMIARLHHDQPFRRYPLSRAVQRQLTVVYGLRDRIAGPRTGTELAKLAPDAKLVAVPHSGHLVQFEALPELDAAVLGT